LNLVAGVTLREGDNVRKSPIRKLETPRKLKSTLSRRTSRLQTKQMIDQSVGL
jgi:hypothetical protein